METLSLFEIWSHDSYNYDGTSEGDDFIINVWVASQEEADKIAHAFKLAQGKFDVRAYYERSGIVRPE